MKRVWIQTRTGYKNGKPRYDVYYWQGGKRQTWAGGIPTKKLAQQALSICLQKINSAVFGDRVAVDLKFARDEYIRKYKLEKATASATKTERALKRFFDFAGELKLDEYTSTDFLEFAEYRQSEVDSKSTVRYDLVTAGAFFKYCHKAGYLERVPEIPNIQTESPKPKTHVSVDEFVRFCSVADSDTRLSCIIGLVTGLRTMDVRNLTAENIQDDYIVTQAQKTGKIERKYLPPLLRELLDGFNGFEKLSQRGFQDRVKKYSNGWTFKSLRETHAQLMRDADYGLLLAQRSLSHSSKRITRDHYATDMKLIIDRLFTPILEKIV